MGSIRRWGVLFSFLLLGLIYLLPGASSVQGQAEETPAVLEPEPTFVPTEATTEPATEIPTEAPTVEPTALPVETQPATELPPQPTAIPTTGGSSPAAALTAPTLRQPRNNAVLTDRTPTFSWREVSGARRYFVQLYNQDSVTAAPGTLRYTSPRVNTLAFDLPQTNRLPNGTYYWNVTAVGTNGRISPASVTRQFVVNQPTTLTPPVTVNDSYTVVSGQTVSAPGILSNDTLNSGAISAVNGSAALTGVSTTHGSVTVAADGSFTYTAVTSYLGPDSFTYTLTNGAGSSTATVSLTVGIGPAAEPDQFLIMVGETLSDDLLSTDALGSPEAVISSFGDGALGGTVTSFTAPSSQTLAGGTLTVNADGTFSLTGTTTDGNYIFQYRLANNLGYSDGTVIIDVCAQTSTFDPCDDTDDDGLADAWEWDHFENLEQLPNGDPDADNCDNTCEQTHGTDPASSDTDDDELADDYEITTTYAEHDSSLPNTTDPLNQDTDNDGLADGQEVNGYLSLDGSGVEQTFYSNPLMRDTDDDGVDDGDEPTTKPVLVNDRYIIGPNHLQTIAAPGLLSNDSLKGGVISAVNGDAGGIGAAVTTDHGVVMLNVDGSFDYVPTSNYLGSDSFTYTLTNNAGSSTATVELRIGVAPSAEDDEFVSYPGLGLDDDLNSYDSLGDPAASVTAFGGGALGGSVTSFTTPSSQPLAGGTLTINADGTFTLTGDLTEGVYTFEYRLANNVGHDDATVLIGVCSYTSTFTLCADTDRDGLLNAWEFKWFGDLNQNTLGDEDGDSCNHACEFYYGTYPTNLGYCVDCIPTGVDSADSDDDGLSDADEVYIYSTDPADPDTDNDGLNDGYEAYTIYTEHDPDVSNTTDPLNPDTDGEGLFDGAEVNGIEVTNPTEVYYSNPLMDDTDGDVLTDYYELYGPFVTNPNTTDTDVDGLNDPEEVSTYFTNPRHSDTDEDGLNDGYEVMTTYTEHDPDLTNTTSPLNPDTDGEGLTDGEEVNGIHVTNPTAVYYSNPLKDDTDGDVLTDYEEVNGIFVPDPNTTDTDGDGLTDREEINGDWGYLTDPTRADTDADGLGDKQEYSHNSNPTNADTDNDGLTDGTEVNGTSFNHFTSDPTDADTDNDELTDFDEVTGAYSGYDSNPRLANSDSDTLSDYQEVTVYSTDPLSTDTDGDAFSDGTEVTAGSDPLDPTSLPVSTNPDTDLDGLHDDWERAYYGNLSTNANSDTDADGCKNNCEYLNMLSPVDADWDVDGLLDGAELYTYHSNPKNADTDSDGLMDGDEVNGTYGYATSPIDDDTDDDGLTDFEEYGGVNRNTVNWAGSTANVECETILCEPFPLNP